MIPSRARSQDATHPAGHDHSRPARKPVGRATSIDSAAAPRTFAKSSRRRRGPSVEYKPNIFGHWLTAVFIAEVESHYDRLVYRVDPRKIISGIAKRTGATEEAVAHILLVGKLRQYRAESREFRKCLAEAAPRANEAGAEVWRRTA